MDTEFSVGQKIVIDNNSRPDDYPNFPRQMECYLGKTAVIKRILDEDSGLTYRIDIDDGNYRWSGRWLVALNHKSEVFGDLLTAVSQEVLK